MLAVDFVYVVCALTLRLRPVRARSRPPLDHCARRALVGLSTVYPAGSFLGADQQPPTAAASPCRRLRALSRSRSRPRVVSACHRQWMGDGSGSRGRVDLAVVLSPVE